MTEAKNSSKLNNLSQEERDCFKLMFFKLKDLEEEKLDKYARKNLENELDKSWDILKQKADAIGYDWDKKEYEDFGPNVLVYEEIFEPTYCKTWSGEGSDEAIADEYETWQWKLQYRKIFLEEVKATLLALSVHPADNILWIDANYFSTGAGNFKLLEKIIGDSSRSGIDCPKRSTQKTIRAILRDKGYEDIAKLIIWHEGKIWINMDFPLIQIKPKKRKS